MVFGDLNDPESEVSRLANSDRAMRLTNSIDDEKDPSKKKALLNTKQFANPKVYYLTSQQWLRGMMRFKKNS